MIVGAARHGNEWAKNREGGRKREGACIMSRDLYGNHSSLRVIHYNNIENMA